MCVRVIYSRTARDKQYMEKKSMSIKCVIFSHAELLFDMLI